jgi:hypothetical protein
MSNLLEQASLVLIPSGYAEDIVYSEIPLDGSGDMVFSRSSNGTRVNSAGLVEVCPWNLWAGSNDFSATYWSQYQLTPTTGTTSDIYGNSSTVYKLIGSVTNSYSFINRSSNGSANTAFSLYAKPNGYTKIGISNRSVGAWNFVVDLVTKVVSNIDDSTSTIVSINVVDAVGDWKRIELVVSTAVQYNLHPLPSNFNSTNFDNVTLNGTDGVWVMASQVNIGSTAKPYFPTTDRLNVPRLTYQNGGGGCPSLLLEKQSTNLILQSNTFNTTWAMFTGPAVTPNTTTSPDGTTSATTLNSSGGTNDFLYQTLSGLTVGATYSFSFYIKNLNSTASRFWGPSGSSIVDLSWSGSTLVSISGTGASFTSVGNDWYRVVQTGTTPTATPTMRIYADVNNTSKSVYIYGAQFEAGSYPTSYIPTTSASATRVADAYSRSLSNIASGTAYINITDNVALGSVGIHLYGPFSITGASLGLHLSRPNGQRLRLWTQASANVFQTTVTNLKLAITWDGTNVNVYQNGVKVVTNYSYALTNVNNLFSNTNLESSATIAEIVLFNSVLTDAECISLTS